MWHADGADMWDDRWQYGSDAWRYGKSDMAHTWANHRLTRGKIQLVFKEPRGPVMGCHVALHHWLLDYGLKKLFGSAEIEPATSGQAKDQHSWANRKSVGCCLFTFRAIFILCLVDGSNS
jgi:hypothetical protein